MANRSTKHGISQPPRRLANRTKKHRIVQPSRRSANRALIEVENSPTIQTLGQKILVFKWIHILVFKWIHEGCGSDDLRTQIFLILRILTYLSYIWLRGLHRPMRGRTLIRGVHNRNAGYGATWRGAPLAYLRL